MERGVCERTLVSVWVCVCRCSADQCVPREHESKQGLYIPWIQGWNLSAGLQA